MEIRELRRRLGVTQSEFSTRYNIPFRTIQNWEAGRRTPPEYIINLLSERVLQDCVNRKTVELPQYDTSKKNLPSRADYIGASSWIKAVQNCLGKDVIFALDEALMCQGSFLGRTDEFIVWVYGDDALTEYNGVVVIGNSINERDVTIRNGIRYTNFNRTLIDSLANEKILDFQGITEALSKYYFEHDESFDGLFIEPMYQEIFEKLSSDAIDYYTY